MSAENNDESIDPVSQLCDTLATTEIRNDDNKDHQDPQDLQDDEDDNNNELVPHLCAAFSLSSQCEVNLDPVVLAVACFLRLRSSGTSAIKATDLLEKGSSWFPRRIVSSSKNESVRMIRFTRAYPHVFEYHPVEQTISLKKQALSRGDAHPCDEAWYTIALYRLAPHDADVVNEALDDIEVNDANVRKSTKSSNLFAFPFSSERSRAIPGRETCIQTSERENMKTCLKPWGMYKIVIESRETWSRF